MIRSAVFHFLIIEQFENLVFTIFLCQLDEGEMVLSYFAGPELRPNPTHRMCSPIIVSLAIFPKLSHNREIG